MENHQGKKASKITLVVCVLSFLAFSFCAAVLINAPFWAGIVVALAILISGLCPPLMFIFILFLIIAAISKIPSIASIGLLLSAGVFSGFLFWESRKGD